MDTQTQNQIGEYYAKLSPKMQTFFSGMEWMAVIRTISETNKFSPTQNETLGTETTLVLLGMISIDEYQQILLKELGLEKSVLDVVMKEIEEKIIKPVAGDLVQIHEKNKVDLATEKYGQGLDERFAKLPTDVKEAVGSVDYANAIVAIGKKQNLTAAQMGILEEETTKVMLGTSHPTEYRERLLTRLGVSREKVDLVVTDANSMIFSQIRESFQKMMEREREVKNEVGDMKKEDTKETPAAQDIPNDLNRDELLSQLENPTRLIPVTPQKESPSIQKIESTPVAPATPAPQPEAASTPPLVQPEPPKATTRVPNFLADKLGSATVTPPTTTDHSLPGMTTAPETSTATQNVSDPYREPIK